jgi:hypothetical protein
MGQTDDCHELTVLRAFRDRYLLAREDGQAAVRHYYEIAPRLIAAIERSLHPEEAFKEIYDALVAPTVRMIEDGHTERAFDYYQTKIIQLAGRYLGSSA